MAYRDFSVVVAFITPLLGSVIVAGQSPRRYQFQRTADREIIVMPGWWRDLLEFGAASLGRHQATIRKVRVSPVVKAETTMVEREDSGEVCQHEAITGLTLAHVAAPVDLDACSLSDILGHGGRFVGIAPWPWAEGYGRFRVIRVSEEGT